MIYSYSQNFEPVKEIEVSHLTCPLSETQEPMKLVLYKCTTEDNISKIVYGKASGVFYRSSDNEPIPVLKWTLDMENFFNDNRHKAEIKGKWSLSVGGKILAALLIVIALGVGYMMMVKKPAEAVAQQAYFELPKAGDRYFGSFFDYRNGMTRALTWAKIENINLADSVMMVKIGTDLTTDYKHPNEVDSENFSEELIPMKFTIEYDAEKTKAQNIQFLGNDIGFHPMKPSYKQEIEEVKKTTNK